MADYAYEYGPRLRCFLSLGLWLEYNIYTNASAMALPYFLAFSDDITVPGGGEKTKETAQNIFGQKVLKADKFKTGGLLGSRSSRKFAATHVRRCGISRDDKEGRGLWKGQGRVSNCYDDLELPYPDCKAAEALCMGGACYYYVIKNNAICNSNTLATFILTKVVPNIREQLPDLAAILLGKAVLWVVYSSVASTYIDDEWRDRIKQDLEETGFATIADGWPESNYEGASDCQWEPRHCLY